MSSSVPGADKLKQELAELVAEMARLREASAILEKRIAELRERADRTLPAPPAGDGRPNPSK